MKTILIMASFVFAFTNALAAWIPDKVEGEVTKVFVGELNSKTGEICAIVIKDYETSRYFGIVEEVDIFGEVCELTQVIERGWPIGVYKSEGLSPIQTTNRYLLPSLLNYSNESLGINVYWMSAFQRPILLDNNY